MKKLSRATQQIYDEIMSEIKYSSEYESRYDLESLGDQIINGGHVPNGNHRHEDMLLDIKFALYNDTYLEMMRETYKKGEIRVGFFRQLLNLYAKAADKPEMLDRIEIIFQMLSDISEKTCVPLFVMSNHTHPRFLARMNCEAERIGVNELIHKIDGAEGDDLLRLMHNWISPDNQKSSIDNLSEEDYAKLKQFLSIHCELDELMDFTMRSSFHSIMHIDPNWAKQFQLQELVERFQFSDINDLFANGNPSFAFGLGKLATHVALLKTSVCQETKKLLSEVPSEHINAIKKMGVVPMSTLIELDWLDAQEKRRTLENDLSL